LTQLWLGFFYLAWFFSDFSSLGSVFLVSCL
jgi:hypothetical protein